MLEYKAMSLGYFLDDMQMYELSAILDGLEYTYRNEWEQARLISYIVAQTQSTKQLHMTDILKFTWDKDDTDENDKSRSMTKEDVERLSRKMNNIVLKNSQIKENENK